MESRSNTSGEVGSRFPFTPFSSVRGESKYSLVAGGQRDSRIELSKTTVGSSVSDETSNSHAHDDVTQAMTMTRTGLWAVGRGADESHTTAAKIPVTPKRWHPGHEQKKHSLTSHLSHAASAGPTSRHRVTAPIHVPRHNLDDEKASTCCEPCEVNFQLTRPGQPGSQTVTSFSYTSLTTIHAV